MNAFQNNLGHSSNLSSLDAVMHQLTEETSVHSSRLSALHQAIEDENRRHQETLAKLQNSLRLLSEPPAKASDDSAAAEEAERALNDPNLWPKDLRDSVIYKGDIISPIDVKWEAESDDAGEAQA